MSRLLPHLAPLTRALTLGSLLWLSGCAVGPNFKTPTAPSNAGYRTTPQPAQTVASATSGGEAQDFKPGADIPAEWWTLFHSPGLNTLIEHALAHNSDLEAAKQALRSAWENVYSQQGAYFPTVNGDFIPTRNRTSHALSNVPEQNIHLYKMHTAQVTVGYDLDLWGRNRRQVESLKAQAEQQRFQLEAAYLSLTSNLVNAAIQEATLRAQIRATENIIASQRQVLDSYLRQRDFGQLADSDVAAQQAQLAQTEATLPPLRKQLEQQHDLIAALSGDTPNEPTPHFELSELQLPTELPVSLPSQLVAQRPDVRAAQAVWHAACAQVGVAIANMLPNINLTGAIGSIASHMGKLFTAGMANWTVGADVSIPIFQGGALLHASRAARANYAQAGASYRSTVIGAFQDVADTLHAIEEDAHALNANAVADNAAARSLQIAQQQQVLGDIDQNTLLNAQQTREQAAINLVQAQAARYADTVALFQSLGGGWWHRHDAAGAGPAQHLAKTLTKPSGY